MQHRMIALRLSLALTIVGSSDIARAQWSNLANAMPNNNPDTCLLLTDGTAMCHEYSTQHWHRLVPDQFGTYQNGKWDPPGMAIADMPNGVDTSGSCNAPSGCTYAPLYFASAVLRDGRVVVIGGEDNPGTSGNGVETNIGFMYDPVTNTWSNQLTEAFGTGNVGDSLSVVLKNGTLVIGNIRSGGMEAFDPSTLAFTALNDTGKLDNNSEEGWTILPNNKILSADASIANSFEIYDPATNTWTSPSPGTTAGITLADTGGSCNSIELGPAIQLANGTVIQFSGGPSGQNAVYDINAGTWAAAANSFPVGPGTEGQLTVSDGPASLLPNGHALVMASPGCKSNGTKFTPFNAPSHLFEWDGTNLNEVTSSGIGFANASSYASYQGRMLLLPSGDVLVLGNNQGGTTTVELYTASGAPQAAWRPAITVAPNSVAPGTTYGISGNRFNGFSQGASYGDDAQMATNYPLVRITSQATGHVFYSRTHDHSRMGIEAVGSTEVVSTNFDVPANAELGASTLVVVANGIPSTPLNLFVAPATTLSFTSSSASQSHYHDAATVQAQLTTNGGATAVSGQVVTFRLGSGISTETCTATTDTLGNATCQITPQEASGNYSLTATFAGNASYAQSSASTPFTVTREETALTFAAGSPTVIANSKPATFSATLKEDGITAISGRSVVIGLGGQSCTGTTDLTGTASCTIVVNQPLGPNTVQATFAGDTFYLPSSTSEPVLDFAFLSSGSFVVGNLNAATGQTVTFWGAQWANINALSGGPANNSFKGFASTAPQSCGTGSFTTPGNSASPPATVPSYMAVIASSSIIKSGSTISGNVPIIVVVQTNPGYGANPGNPGTGTVVGVFCQ